MVVNETVAVSFLKIYGVAIVATVFGALAHAFNEVSKAGWKGWLNFITDLVVCSFVGWIFFHLACIEFPQYAVLACSIGSFWGTKGFNFARDMILKSIKTNLEKI